MQLRARLRAAVRRGHAPATTSNRIEAGTARLILMLACLAQFMVVLDVSVVNVALPSIRTALGFSATSLQWVVNAYALAFAGCLLLGGRLADIFGRKRVFLAGLAIFTAASLAGGLAGSPALLIAARAAQGIGAAILAPATLTILTTTFPEGAERNRALAIWTAVGVGGGAAGNLAGGLLTEYLSWRWVLLVNVPVGLPALLLATRCLPADRGGLARRRLDVPGALAATAGLIALTYGITRVETAGAGDPATLAALAVGLAALGLFVAVEARFAVAPLIPLRLFRSRAISAGNLVMLLAGACFIPMWYFLSLTMQNVLGYGALKTGAAFIPHTLTTMAGSLVAPRLLRKLDARRLVALGAGIAMVGFIWQSRFAPDSDYLTGILGPALLISGGLGLLITPLTAAVTSGVDASDAGAASGLMNATRQVGGALGLALFITITGGEAPGIEGLASAYSHAFLAIAAILAVVAPAALLLPAEQRDETAPAAGGDGIPQASDGTASADPVYRS